MDQTRKMRPRIDESKYAGQWVALHPETLVVVSHAKTLKSARQAAAQRGVSDPVMHAVPENDGYFVGPG
jgi:hypothetical protein